MHRPPLWAEQTIWWHVYPLGFTGAPIRDADPAPPVTARLRRLEAWLDELIALGCNGLLLGPIFASSTHGYDTLDHWTIDARLGGDADFNALVEACRARGIRLLLDGVFSHVGREHPRLRQALLEGRESEAASVFDIEWDAEGGPRPRVFEGHGALARLAHDRSTTVDATVRIMRHWLDRGADGWRLDAAYSVAPEFWAEVLPQVRATHPDAFFLGEVLHGDYAGFVAGSGVDSVTQYELWKAVWSSLADRNLFELDWTLQRHNALLDAFVPQTFIGNHDVTRIASRVGVDGAIAALAVLMLAGGMPSIYAGDERALLGVKAAREGGDDAVRPEFPVAPQEPRGEALRVFRAHQGLIGLRRRHPWLVTARTRSRLLENERAVFESESADGSERLTLELELANGTVARVLGADGAVLWAS